MDTVKKYLKEYEPMLLTGASAVGLGYLVKKIWKKELVAVNNLRDAGESFVLVSTSTILANNIYKGMKPL